jgi:putative membrane protein
VGDGPTSVGPRAGPPLELSKEPEVRRGSIQVVKLSAEYERKAMRLVVCIDRDDDLGRKAGVAGPVVGRAPVLDAAVRLGTVDPEDSDTNAIFAAVSLLDELRGAGEECEVCILTGSPKVGVLSDRRVADQFDRVLGDVHASSAYLVSDGAEDEFLFPILASRVRVDGVRRVYVRQAASLESTYYTLVRALKDPKLRAKTILPFALVLLILGLAAAGNVLIWGVIGLAIVLGVYLIFWTFDIDEAIIDSVRSASTDIRQGSVAFGFGLFAVALVGVGFLEGYNAYYAALSNPLFVRTVLFLQSGLLWWIMGAITWEVGRAIRRTFSRGRFPRSFVVATTSIVGIGLVSYGITFLIQFLEGIAGPPQLPLLAGLIVTGFGLVIGAGVLQQYFKAAARRSLAEATTSN